MFCKIENHSILYFSCNRYAAYRTPHIKLYIVWSHEIVVTLEFSKHLALFFGGFHEVTLNTLYVPYSMFSFRINQIRLAFIFWARFHSILTIVLDYLVVENAIQCPVLPFFVGFYSEKRSPRKFLIKISFWISNFDLNYEQKDEEKEKNGRTVGRKWSSASGSSEEG